MVEEAPLVLRMMLAQLRQQNEMDSKLNLPLLRPSPITTKTESKKNITSPTPTRDRNSSSSSNKRRNSITPSAERKIETPLERARQQLDDLMKHKEKENGHDDDDDLDSLSSVSSTGDLPPDPSLSTAGYWMQLQNNFHVKFVQHKLYVSNEEKIRRAQRMKQKEKRILERKQSQRIADERKHAASAARAAAEAASAALSSWTLKQVAEETESTSDDEDDHTFGLTKYYQQRQRSFMLYNTSNSGSNSPAIFGAKSPGLAGRSKGRSSGSDGDDNDDDNDEITKFFQRGDNGDDGDDEKKRRGSSTAYSSTAASEGIDRKKGVTSASGWLGDDEQTPKRRTEGEDGKSSSKPSSSPTLSPISTKNSPTMDPSATPSTPIQVWKRRQVENKGKLLWQSFQQEGKIGEKMMIAIRTPTSSSSNMLAPLSPMSLGRAASTANSEVFHAKFGSDDSINSSINSPGKSGVSVLFGPSEMGLGGSPSSPAESGPSSPWPKEQSTASEATNLNLQRLSGTFKAKAAFSRLKRKNTMLKTIGGSKQNLLQLSSSSFAQEDDENRSHNSASSPPPPPPEIPDYVKQRQALRQKQLARLKRLPQAEKPKQGLLAQWCEMSRDEPTPELARKVSDFFKGTHFHTSLSDKQREAILNRVEIMELPAGENVFVPGAMNEIMYIVVSGSVQVLKPAHSKLECERVLHVGDSFGVSGMKTLTLVATNRGSIFRTDAVTQLLTLTEKNCDQLFMDWGADDAALKEKTVRGFPLFSNVPDSIIQNLLPMFKLIRFPRGSFVFRQYRDRNRHMFIIVQGKVMMSIRVTLEDQFEKRHHEIQLVELGEREFFGEMELFHMRLPIRLMTARCLSDVILLQLPRAQMLDNLPEDPLRKLWTKSKERGWKFNARIKLSLETFAKYNWYPLNEKECFLPALPELSSKDGLVSDNAPKIWLPSSIASSSSSAQVMPSWTSLYFTASEKQGNFLSENDPKMQPRGGGGGNKDNNNNNNNSSSTNAYNAIANAEKQRALEMKKEEGEAAMRVKIGVAKKTIPLVEILKKSKAKQMREDHLRAMERSLA